MDPDVDFTYWEFDIKFSKDLIDKYEKADYKFTQRKYIITNRRIVHVFNNDKYYHASGFHNNPTNVVEFLKGLFIPDSVRFMPGPGPVTYGLNNKANKIKSFLNIQDQKYLKIQTSYLSESLEVIEDLSYIFSNNLNIIETEHSLNESNLKAIQEDYMFIEKLLYIYNPNNMVDLTNRDSENSYVKSLSLSEEQVSIILKNSKFIEEELNCYYVVEDNEFKIFSK